MLPSLRRAAGAPLVGAALIAAALAAPSAALAQDPAKDAVDKPAADKPAADKPAVTEDEADPNVMRYPPRGVRWGLILGGSTLTLGTYVATLSAGFGWPDVPGSDFLKIPIAGPWIALAKNGCSKDITEEDGSCGASIYVRGVLEVLSGLVQVAGLPLIGEGIFMTTEAPGKVDPSAEPPPPKESANLVKSLMVAPIVTPTTGGIGIYGTF